MLDSFRGEKGIKYSQGSIRLLSRINVSDYDGDKARDNDVVAVDDGGEGGSWFAPLSAPLLTRYFTRLKPDEFCHVRGISIKRGIHGTRVARWRVWGNVGPELLPQMANSIRPTMNWGQYKLLELTVSNQSSSCSTLPTCLVTESLYTRRSDAQTQSSISLVVTIFKGHSTWSRSLEVIGNDTVRSNTCDPTLRLFRDKRKYWSRITNSSYPIHPF